MLKIFKVFRTKIVLAVLALGGIQTAHAQMYQTVRGVITDKESQMALENALITFQFEGNKDSVRETRSDKTGSFEIKRAWVGRNEMKVSLNSYTDYVANGVILSSGKEGVFYVSLEKEFVERLGSIDLKARKNNDQTNNDAALISARLFTVEETDRFAGSRGDPARMASNFAGVQGADDSRNDIVVRGNSPRVFCGGWKELIFRIQTILPFQALREGRFR